LWLPDLYNRLALYSERHPNHTFTFCEAVTALANSTALTHSFILATGIDNKTSGEISNLTSSGLAELSPNDTVAVRTVASHARDTANQNVTSNVKVNVTLDATVLSNTTVTPTCSSTVNPAAFRNSLAIGIVCIFVYAFAGYLVKFVKRKPLMSKLNS
jgi:preprotein translocase subunit SecF